ncbi:hypothetical protein ACVNNN_19840 [Lysinibacillus fusiformis]|uniref:hypothetical protein n=1 Tax=Lysinibacillus sp. PWR01 TaxID=3342384 RepID=UPI00372D1B66
MKVGKKSNILFLAFGLFLILAACSEQTETESPKTDTVPTTEDSSTDKTTKDSESADSEKQSKPLAEMTLDDLNDYFVKLDLVKEGAKISKVGGIGSDAIKYMDENVEIYWYDLNNMDQTLQKEYNSAKKDGYVTLAQSNSIIMFEVHGPFGINASASPRAEEFINAVKALK